MNKTTHIATIAHTIMKTIQLLISSAPRNRGCLEFGRYGFVATLAVPELSAARRN
jgi:hypothetical protein